MGTQFVALLGFAGPLSMIVMLAVFGLLSRRLGAVSKRQPLYRWFFVGIALVGLASVLRLLHMNDWGRLAGDAALAYDIPLVLGLTLSVVVAWRYWGWLLYEQDTDL